MSKIEYKDSCERAWERFTEKTGIEPANHDITIGEEPIDWNKVHRKNCGDGAYLEDVEEFNDKVCSIYSAQMAKHNYGKSSIAWQNIYDISVTAAETTVFWCQKTAWGKQLADWRDKDYIRDHRGERILDDETCDAVNDTRNFEETGVYSELLEIARALGGDYETFMEMRIDGYLDREIAEKLGVSERTVRRMRNKLGEIYGI